MKDSTRDEIYAHAVQSFPRECCGLVVDTPHEGERYFRCRNRAISAAEHFMMDGEDYARAEDAGTITMLVHSHPNVPARASDGDRASCERMGIPYYIVAVYQEGNALPRVVADAVIVPNGHEAPYVGRNYQFGMMDCYTLVQDWYRREMGAVLADVPRRDGFWLVKGGPELYLERFEAMGFHTVTDGSLKHGDGILMQIRSKVQANHAGIFLEGGKLLHHMYNRLSTCDQYNAYYRNVTRMVVRR